MFKVVQPWGPDKARDATVVSEHATVDEAFAEIDRIASMTEQNGTGGDYLELLVVDAEGHLVSRPRAH